MIYTEIPVVYMLQPSKRQAGKLHIDINLSQDIRNVI